MGSCSDRFLDRISDEIAPLSPGAVIVADPVVAEKVSQHEPGERGSFADPAIGYDVLVSSDALCFVQFPKVRDFLERAVFTYRL